VLGVNAASRPGWDRNTSADLFHDPFVLFGFLAGCTNKLGFSTGVLILPQRQTVLVAKQAASLDVLCGGRFRLGIGVGWNEVEFTGLNENFHNRGRRSEEQVQVMQALWAEPHVSFNGRWHTIEDAGINPLPASRKVPVWFGGHHERTLPRIAKWGDGWMPNAYGPDQEALDVFTRPRRLTEEAGRDPAKVGIEVWVSMGTGAEADWAGETRFWKQAGASHICLTTTFNRRHHKRIPGHNMAGHPGGVAALPRRRRRPALAGAQVLHRLVAAEEVEEGAQRSAALAFEVGVVFEDEAGVVMGDCDQLLVGRQVGEAEGRQPALARPQNLTGAAQTQILFGDAEAVLGLAQDTEALLCHRAEWRLVKQQAGRRLVAAPDAAAQLM
jgi:probable F420-dependent oxidoreductase